MPKVIQNVSSKVHNSVIPYINIFYLSPNPYGGWVTYTAHLIHGLKRLGIDVRFFKIGQRDEPGRRPFGYNLSYQNISVESALGYVKANQPCLVTAVHKNQLRPGRKLVDNGAWLVMHDPTEFRNLKLSNNSRIITVRKTVHKILPHTHLILHPYVRTHSLEEINKVEFYNDRKLACSIARIDFDKHTELLLDANRLLPDTHKINIYGFENRIYTKNKIVPNYPEWEQSKAAYDKGMTTAIDICKQHTFSIDMSVIKEDGGGTQYTFLEAADAGSVNIIHKDWIRDGDEMNPYPNEHANCLIAHDGKSIAKLIQDKEVLRHLPMIRQNMSDVLDRHDATVVAQQMVELISSKM